MENRIYGSLSEQGLEVIERDGKYFVRYDAGGLQSAWREDELSLKEFQRLSTSPQDEYHVINGLQKRIRARGEDPNMQNWSPEQRA